MSQNQPRVKTKDYLIENHHTRWRDHLLHESHPLHQYHPAIRQEPSRSISDQIKKKNKVSIMCITALILEGAAQNASGKNP